LFQIEIYFTKKECENTAFLLVCLLIDILSAKEAECLNKSFFVIRVANVIQNDVGTHELLEY